MKHPNILAGTLVLASIFCANPARAQFATPATLPVRDLDNPARQPVQFTTSVSFAAGQQFATTSDAFIVPAHKRLVIEMVTGEIFVPTNQELRVGMITIADGVRGKHRLIFATRSFSNISQDILSAFLPLRAYADAGTEVLFEIQRSSSTGISGVAEITMSGYLVNI
jgi:hypothetical protein